MNLRVIEITLTEVEFALGMAGMLESAAAAAAARLPGDEFESRAAEDLLEVNWCSSSLGNKKNQFEINQIIGEIVSCSNSLFPDCLSGAPSHRVEEGVQTPLLEAPPALLKGARPRRPED